MKVFLIIFAVYLLAAFILIFTTHAQDAGMCKSRRAKKMSNILFYIGMSLGGLVLFAIASYIFGFIWYYFCGGGLLFMDLGGGWFDKLLLGAGTLLCFGFLLSGIVFIFKK